jgi:hypothetical protein
MPIRLRCYECKGPFGLSRRHHWGRAFCSQTCLDAWKLGLDHEVARLRRLSWFKPPDLNTSVTQKPPEAPALIRGCSNQLSYPATESSRQGREMNRGSGTRGI